MNINISFVFIVKFTTESPKQKRLATLLAKPTPRIKRKLSAT